MDFSFTEIFEPDSFLSILTQPFFFALAIAALKPAPESIVLTSSKVLGPSFIKSISFRSGKPVLNALIPFCPSEISTLDDSFTCANSFSRSHSIPRLI